LFGLNWVSCPEGSIPHYLILGGILSFGEVLVSTGLDKALIGKRRKRFMAAQTVDKTVVENVITGGTCLAASWSDMSLFHRKFRV
jgi:hypothetical protein